MHQINKDFLAAQLELEVISFIQERLEFIMREEIQNFLQVEHPETMNIRLLEDVNVWRKRPLKKRYSVVYMD